MTDLDAKRERLHELRAGIQADWKSGDGYSDPRWPEYKTLREEVIEGEIKERSRTWGPSLVHQRWAMLTDNGRNDDRVSKARAILEKADRELQMKFSQRIPREAVESILHEVKRNIVGEWSRAG
jgi:hypothetical protein